MSMENLSITLLAEHWRSRAAAHPHEPVTDQAVPQVSPSIPRPRCSQRRSQHDHRRLMGNNTTPHHTTHATIHSVTCCNADGSSRVSIAACCHIRVHGTRAAKPIAYSLPSSYARGQPAPTSSSQACPCAARCGLSICNTWEGLTAATPCPSPGAFVGVQGQCSLHGTTLHC